MISVLGQPVLVGDIEGMQQKKVETTMAILIDLITIVMIIIVMMRGACSKKREV